VSLWKGKSSEAEEGVRSQESGVRRNEEERKKEEVKNSFLFLLIPSSFSLFLPLSPSSDS
jgi:hypothetical protein